MAGPIASSAGSQKCQVFRFEDPNSDDCYLIKECTKGEVLSVRDNRLRRWKMLSNVLGQRFKVEASRSPGDMEPPHLPQTPVCKPGKVPIHDLAIMVGLGL